MVNDLNKLIDQLQLDKTLSNLIFNNYIPQFMLSEEVSSYFTNEIGKVFLQWQGIYFEGNPKVALQDKTGFKYWIPEIEREIKINLKKSALGFKKTSKSKTAGTLLLLSDRFLGIGAEISPTNRRPIKWAKYFIEGSLEDDLIWINKEVYSKLGNKTTSLGRFGTGFLIKGSPAFNSFFKKVVGEAVERYRDAQSGQGGRGEDLQKVIDEFPFEALVLQPAVDKAITKLMGG